MPEQPAYRGWTRGEFPKAEHMVKRILCIPAHEKMRTEDIEYVCEAIKGFYQRT
jgi:dTDP-4-amino-4,6-dideoxygalactose transaminase